MRSCVTILPPSSLRLRNLLFLQRIFQQFVRIIRHCPILVKRTFHLYEFLRSSSRLEGVDRVASSWIVLGEAS